MASYFFDTSALIKLYIDEEGTFVCADGRLCDAAAREGLATLNPLHAGGM